MNADVIIVGGGPAGAVAGARLAQAGISCLILEKDRFPRFHIGESLLPASNQLLHRIGVLEKIRQAGFLPKYGARFCDPHYRHVKRISFNSALTPVPGGHAFQVERAKYDQLLLEHARELGCVVQHGRRVKSFKEDAEGVSVHCLGDDEPLRARWMLDASGRDCLSVRQYRPRRSEMPGFNKRIALYTHLSSVRLAEGEEAGDTVAVRFEDGWAWIIPLDDEKTSVGIVLDSSSFEKGADPADVYWRKLRRSPYLRNVLEKAQPLDRMHVTADYSYFYESPVSGPRVLPLGDAFGFLDPIFSSGVHLAESSAFDAADLIGAHRHSGSAFSLRERMRYEKGIRQRATSFRRIVEAFYDSDGFKVFLDPGDFLNIADAVTNIVAGDRGIRFSVRWRYELFLLICRLQRSIPIVATARKVDLNAPEATG